MSQTKQECMEYIIVLLDNMKSEVKKLIHYDNYSTYEAEPSDTESLHELLTEIDDELSDLDTMFENCIPPEVKKIKHLEEENEALKNNLGVLRNQISDLEKKLAFSLTIK